MSTRSSAEHTVLVFCIWASVGFLGVGGLMEGFARDSVPVSLLGIAALCVAFVAHIVVNALLGRGFGRGEAAFGVGAFGFFAFVFIAAWLSGELSRADYLSGLAAFGALAAGFMVYLSTRYGLRGAFSRFHIAGPPGNGGGGR